MNMKQVVPYLVLSLLAMSCADEASSSSSLQDAHYIFIQADQGGESLGRIYLKYDNEKSYSVVFHHHDTTKAHQLAVVGELDFDPLEAFLLILNNPDTARAYCVTIEHGASDLEVVDDRTVHCFDQLTDDKALTRLFEGLDQLLTNGQSNSVEQQELRDTIDWPLPGDWFP